ncbi:superoxide dismutase [Mn/Fe]-like [Rhopilema esculentum]|uniref:superoxide dismutase [Mn/Fe]-like n=1 Tax=Rhopilema esculentum TaxID=499914 RepID=UPI0031DC2E4B|eukprot:gene13715-4635_t
MADESLVWKFFLLLLAFVSCKAFHPYEDALKIKDEYPLPRLNYGYDALEPFVDAKTMKVHHSGHHAAYTKKMNNALEQWRASEESNSLSKKSILEIMKSIEDVPEKWKTALRNNGGGYLNHAIFFSLLSPNPSKEDRVPTGKVLNHIVRSFGNFTAFKEMFSKSALSLFGSGYVWLCREPKTNALTYLPTINQQSPVSYGLNPILVIDVWEHAYYLKHQNKRANYIDNWWNVVDWSAVQDLYDFWDKDSNHEEL